MPTYLILNSDQDLPRSLSETLLLRPNTTLIAATRYLTPEISNTFFHLPRHAASTVIPVKIDVFSEYDAAGTVRGLLFAGVLGIDTVVVSGNCRNGNTATGPGVDGDVGGKYDEGVRSLLRQAKMFLDRSRVVLLGGGEMVNGSRGGEVVMREVGDVAYCVHVDISDGDEESTVTERILQLMDKA